MGRHTYIDFGMINRKNCMPDKQWELLLAFADNDGEHTPFFTETSKFRQQKFILCTNLRNVLGIKENPIKWNPYFKMHKCDFVITKQI